MSGAADASTEKMMNIPKASDDQEARSQKEQRDPAETHGQKPTDGKPHATEPLTYSDNKADHVVN